MKTEQQYKALAAMLPEQLTCRSWMPDGGDHYEIGLYKYKTDGSTILRVLPSELLGLCYEIEEGLTAIQCDKYIEELKEIIRRNITKMGESAKCVHASVEQRIEALAKVKGI